MDAPRLVIFSDIVVFAPWEGGVLQLQNYDDYYLGRLTDEIYVKSANFWLRQEFDNLVKRKIIFYKLAAEK